MNPNAQARLLAGIRIDDAIEVTRALREGASFWEEDPATRAKPLHFAVRIGAVHAAKALVTETGAIDPGTYDRRTPFVLALELGHIEIARFLEARRNGLGGADLGIALLSFVKGPCDDGEFFSELLAKGFPLLPSGPEESLYGLAGRLGKSGIRMAIERHSADPACARAIARDDAKTLLALLSHRPGALEKRDAESACTLLMLAARSGAVECTRALVSLGVDVEAPMQDPGRPDTSPLAAAIESGTPEAAREILYVTTQIADPLRTTILSSLVRTRKDTPGFVRALIRKGATYGDSPRYDHLTEDFRAADMPMAAQEVADALRDFDTLCVAIQANDLGTVRERLEAGADPNERKSESGPTLLRIAAQTGNAEVVDLLLERGADPDVPRHWKDRPLYVAIQRGDLSVATKLLQKSAPSGWYPDGQEISEALVQKGLSSPDLVHAFLAICMDFTEGPQTDLLTRAAAAGDTVIVRCLLERGVRPCGLLEAARKGQTETLTLLLGAGADIAQVDGEGNTALHLAVLAEQPAATAVLLASGGLSYVKNAQGYTAYELAVRSGREDMIRLWCERSNVSGPTWFQNAFARGLDERSCYIVYLRRGLGIGFCPFDKRTPCRVGGEDEGFGWPATAAEALTLWERHVETEPHLRSELEWFGPFLRMLEKGEDFSLEEFENSAPARVRLVVP